ncbi:hypothetical protein D3C84_435640 [compost metagenome]
MLDRDQRKPLSTAVQQFEERIIGSTNHTEGLLPVATGFQSLLRAEQAALDKAIPGILRIALILLQKPYPLRLPHILIAAGAPQIVDETRNCTVSLQGIGAGKAQAWVAGIGPVFA